MGFPRETSDAPSALEERCADLERRLRLWSDHGSDVFYEVALDGSLVWMSPSAERVLGRDPESLIGTRPWDLLHPEDRERAESALVEISAGVEAPAGTSFRLRHADGSYREMTFAGRVLMADGAPTGFVGSLRDVTAEREAMTALAASEARYRMLVEHSADVVVHSVDGIVDWISPSVEAVVGWTPAELVGTALADLMHPDDESAGGHYFRLRTKSGEYRWMSGLPTIAVDHAGAVVGEVVGLRDVHDLVQARDAAQRDRGRLQATLDSLIDPHVLLDAVRDERGAIVDFTCSDANQAACAYLDRTRAELLEGSLLQTSLAAEGSGLLTRIIDVVDGGQSLILDDFVYVNDVLPMADLHFDLRGVKVGDGLSLTWRDITDRQSTIDAMAASEEQFRLLAENSSDVVLRIRRGIVLWVSPSITTSLGWTPQEVSGRHVGGLVHPDDRDYAALEQAKVDVGGAVMCRFRVRARDGRYHWVENHARPYLDAAGVQDGLVASTHVVDAEVATERELEWRACHDELTGLLSRKAALERLSFIGRCKRKPGDEYAVVFCDIDAFKSINDTHGHATGDEILRSFASRITSTVRGGDVVARVGGDEILVVLDGVHDIDEARMIAEKIRVAVKRPVPMAGESICATVSVGVTVACPGDSIDAMVTRADEAMYRAKKAGRDRVLTIAPL